MTQVSIELPDELAAEVAAIAEIWHGTFDDAVCALIATGLRDQSGLPPYRPSPEEAAAIAQADADFLAGRWTAHETVMARAEDMLGRG